MTQRMKALKTFQVGDKTFAAGDIFKVKPRDVGNLSASGDAEVTSETETKGRRAQKAQAGARTPPRAKQGAKAPARAKDVSALSLNDLRTHARELGLTIPRGATKADVLKKVKGRYNRRDMRAG